MATLIPNFFFLNGDLHKKLRTISSSNTLVAFNYEREERTHYNYQQAVRNFQHAYKTREVADLVGKKESYLKDMIKRKLISKPSGVSYAIASRRPGPVYWSEDDVFNLRSELFALARKNKYGEPYSNFKLISEAELLHKMRGGESYFIQDKHGNFVKVWRAI